MVRYNETQLSSTQVFKVSPCWRSGYRNARQVGRNWACQSKPVLFQVIAATLLWVLWADCGLLLSMRHSRTNYNQISFHRQKNNCDQQAEIASLRQKLWVWSFNLKCKQLAAPDSRYARLVADSSIKKNYRKAILLVSNLGGQWKNMCSNFQSNVSVSLKQGFDKFEVFWTTIEPQIIQKVSKSDEEAVARVRHVPRHIQIDTNLQLGTRVWLVGYDTWIMYTWELNGSHCVSTTQIVTTQHITSDLIHIW